ncbi:MAG TPA: hypothetical protein DCG33_00965 [Prevotellaceae bacterium]|nr:hypothetical protein [Prevotellaceae bacterium]
MNIQSILILAIILLTASWVVFRLIKGKGGHSCGECSCCGQRDCSKKCPKKTE